MDSSLDQRKRTLDALERRFALAKAQLDQRRDVSNTRSGDLPGKASDSAASTPTKPPELAGRAFAGSSLLKGRDAEADGLTYSHILEHIHDEHLKPKLEDSSRKRTGIDHVLHELLQRGDSAQKYMQGARVMKLDHVLLLDNYVQKRNSSAGAHVRALKARSKRSRIHMSMKKLKKHGVFSLPQDLCKFDEFKPMHNLWREYIVELLRISGKNQIEQCFLQADLHGAIILVANCKVTPFAGARGIMIRETAETFGIITEEDKFIVVPKRGSVFIMQVDCWKVTIHGDKLGSRDLGL
ncbi:hypothetical protein MLD38_038441 [Melastoma candidum]|uniref:Uncharacterized protein n=1 Tax=Melastoma candidum TaxID=119954 RepID=A0ACB9KZM3_9MYRT|nr:hypothetical protein MLD38_038441 [Melastoma candidum]